MEQLWDLVYRYARNRGRSHHDAEDFAQDLLIKLCSKGTLAQWARETQSQSHFEAFVMISAKRLSIDQSRKMATIKRGRDCAFVSWDGDSSGNESFSSGQESERFCPPSGRVASSSPSPSDSLLLEETMGLIELSRERLREEYRAAGREPIFDALQASLDPRQGSSVSYEECSEALGRRQATVRVDVSRLKSRFRELVAIALAA